MFLSENFKNFIKSSVSKSVLQAYSQSSFVTMTSCLTDVIARIKSKVAMANGLLSISDIALDKEDPNYNLIMRTNMDEAVDQAIHETEFSNEIQTALDELCDLSKECGLSDEQTPQAGQSKSVSVFGPDGKQYDFVVLSTPKVIGNDITCKIATCENPNEIGDCFLFSKNGVNYVNPIIRGADYLNGQYYPESDEGMVTWYAELMGIELDPTSSFVDQVSDVAGFLEVDFSGSNTAEEIVQDILRQYYDDARIPIDLSSGLHYMLEDEYTVRGTPLTVQGSISTISALASSFAEQASVDQLYSDIADALVHGHFDVQVISGIAEQYSNMRDSYSSAVNNLHVAYAKGGIPGLVTYIVEYYRQGSQQTGDSATSTWKLTDQATLIPKDFVCNVASIVVQTFAVLAQVVGAFWGIIGMAIGGVLSTGLNLVAKLINFVNDKGRCFYTTGLSFYPAANMSIFQCYIDAHLASLRLLELLLANPSIYTVVPGAIMILSMDKKRDRIICDFHPLYSNLDLSGLVLGSSANPAIDYCDYYSRPHNMSDLLTWYSGAISMQDITYDPNASEVSDEERDVRNQYLSAAADAQMYTNIRHNITAFFTYLVILCNGSFSYSGWWAEGGRHLDLDTHITMGLFCGLYDLSANHADVVNTRWGWGSDWTTLITKCAAICEWGKSLWDPDLPTINSVFFTDSYSGTYPPSQGVASVTLSDMIPHVVTSNTAMILEDLKMINNDAQWALIVPRWNSASFWAVFIGSAIVTAVIAAVVVITSVAISRKITAARAKRQARVESAWSEYTKNPDSSELYDEYRRSVRSNNLFANVFGGTKYSKNNYWQTTGDSTPVASDTGEGDSIITQLYSTYTGTDVNPDPVNEVVTLIRGTL